MSSAAPTLRALVAGLVDYAGLFPPASLGMAAATANYASYLAAPEAWMLGRFVVPVARLDELAAEARHFTPESGAPWSIAAIGSGIPTADREVVGEFNVANRGRLLIDVIEHRAASVRAVNEVARAALPGVTLYVELPLADEPRPLLEVVGRVGARAKARTGGVVADAFPSPPALARFIVRCAELGIPFKATAGLHHPLRSEHPLTYLPHAPQSTMFGFLGVFTAAAFSRAGMNEATIVELLEERDATSLAFGDRSLRWRQHTVLLDELRQTRASLAIAFGSCSFSEPVDDLRQLHLIES